LTCPSADHDHLPMWSGWPTGLALALMLFLHPWSQTRPRPRRSPLVTAARWSTTSSCARDSPPRKPGPGGTTPPVTNLAVTPGARAYARLHRSELAIGGHCLLPAIAPSTKGQHKQSARPWHITSRSHFLIVTAPSPPRKP